MISHPDRIGPYRIVRILGQGGMGLVYEAEQLEPLRRTALTPSARRSRSWIIGDTLAKVARAQVVKLYERWGKVEQAADYRKGGP